MDVPNRAIEPIQCRIVAVIMTFVMFGPMFVAAAIVEIASSLHLEIALPLFRKLYKPILRRFSEPMPGPFVLLFRIAHNYLLGSLYGMSVFYHFAKLMIHDMLWSLLNKYEMSLAVVLLWGGLVQLDQWVASSDIHMDEIGEFLKDMQYAGPLIDVGTRTANETANGEWEDMDVDALRVLAGNDWVLLDEAALELAM